jgi:two-component system cell cycle response regulator
MVKAQILVIDDNRSLVRIIARLLQKEGFEVLTAFDGQDGLAKAHQERPDLIIMDVVMPKLNGYEVCQRLQSAPDTAAIPVLLLTVKGQLNPDADEHTLESCVQEQIAGFEAGAADFLSKPVRAKELLDRVRTLLWFEGFPGLEEFETGDRQT